VATKERGHTSSKSPSQGLAGAGRKGLYGFIYVRIVAIDAAKERGEGGGFMAIFFEEDL
jgi:hypothetical protein